MLFGAILDITDSFSFKKKKNRKAYLHNKHRTVEYNTFCQHTVLFLDKSANLKVP